MQLEVLPSHCHHHALCVRPTGVRYPAQLLGDVVATLSKAQELISAPTQVEGAPVLQKATLEAAAMGAGGAIRAEPPTPVDKKSLAKALRSVSCNAALRHTFWSGSICKKASEVLYVCKKQ